MEISSPEPKLQVIFCLLFNTLIHEFETSSAKMKSRVGVPSPQTTISVLSSAFATFFIVAAITVEPSPKLSSSPNIFAGLRIAKSFQLCCIL